MLPVTSSCSTSRGIVDGHLTAQMFICCCCCCYTLGQKLSYSCRTTRMMVLNDIDLCQYHNSNKAPFRSLSSLWSRWTKATSPGQLPPPPVFKSMGSFLLHQVEKSHPNTKTDSNQQSFSSHIVPLYQKAGGEPGTRNLCRYNIVFAIQMNVFVQKTCSTPFFSAVPPSPQPPNPFHSFRLFLHDLQLLRNVQCFVCDFCPLSYSREDKDKGQRKTDKKKNKNLTRGHSFSCRRSDVAYDR